MRPPRGRLRIWSTPCASSCSEFASTRPASGVPAWSEPDWTVHYVEQWATEADMRQRVLSDRFTSLLAILESSDDPRVQFDFVTTTRGLDYVAQVRGELQT